MTCKGYSEPATIQGWLINYAWYRFLPVYDVVGQDIYIIWFIAALV